MNKINKLFNNYINKNKEEKNIFIEPFFEKNIIIEKSDNIIIENGKKFYLEKENIYSLTEDYEGNLNYYFSIYKINDKYILFYRAWKHDNSLTLGNYDETHFAYSLSENGLSFINKNILLKNNKNAHNFFPYFYKNKIIALGGTSDIKYSTGGLNLFEFKNDTFELKKEHIINTKNMLPTEWHPGGNHFDSLNTINYYEKKFYIHCRHNKIENPSRQSQLFITENFDTISYPEVCKYWNEKNLIQRPFYYPGIIPYLNTNYVLSIPTYFVSTFDKCPDSLFFSKKNDQLNFFQINNLKLNKNCSFVNGIVPNLNNDKYFIYVVNNYGNKNLNIDCFSIEKDRFKCISCKEKGYFKIKINNEINIYTLLNNFFINFESFNDGFINIQIINDKHEIIYNSDNVSGNHIECKICFKNIIKLNNNNNLYLIFNINNSSLYSYKLDNSNELDNELNKNVEDKLNKVLNKNSNELDNELNKNVEDKLNEVLNKNSNELDNKLDKNVGDKLNEVLHLFLFQTPILK